MKPHVLSFSISRYSANTFGKTIKKARLEQVLKQRDLAHLAGADEMTILNWERYATAPMRGDGKVHRLCDVVSIDFDSLATNHLHVV